jgi:uncharacterized protein YdbL (DUF1318 family)
MEPMKNMKLKTAFAAIAAAVLMAGSANAASPAIESAKDRCVIGEQADGYLGVIEAGAVDEALRREMKSINLQRKAAYANLAERNGVSIEAAAALTAEKLINAAPAGQCIQMPDGDWVKK